MLAGGPYDATDPTLVADRRRCQEILRDFNARPERELAGTELGSLFAEVGEATFIEPPFLCDYGFNIRIGDESFINYGGIVLDVAPVTIGDQVRIATGVQLLTADHPVDPVERRKGVELSRPITIGDGVWVGGGAIVCPGVTIGANSVVGAGSVLTRDIPPSVLAVGNPCRVVRSLVD
jgi:maltose O-acetyltransferase